MLTSRLILLIVILSAFALWFNLEQNTEDTLSSSSLQSTDYSWQLFNSTTWQLNKTSQQSTIIQSDTLFFDDAAKTSDFTHPRVTLIDEQQTLFIESQQGQTSNNDLFELRGQVSLIQFDQTLSQLNKATQNKTLTTEYITYNSKTEKISSDQAVVITQPSTNLVGTGLEIDLKTDHFQLLSNVKGEYRPIKAE